VLMAAFQLLQTFAQDVTQAFVSLGTAEPEAQLTTPVQNLVSQMGAGFGSSPTLRRETRVKEVGGRPDFGVDVGGVLCGFIELKAPGRGARPDRFSGRDKEQWKKFQSLPNLLYTDGNEWTLFQEGVAIGKTLRLAGDVVADGTAAATPENALALETLLQEFLGWEPIVPAQPRELAKLLAPVCRLIRGDVEAAIKDPDSALSVLAGDWRRLLFPEADDAKFADAYAQTLTYGLLLARVEGGGTLTIESAARTLDQNHNLLAQAVRVLGQQGARDELGAGLDVLLRVLNALDASVWQGSSMGQDDPWLYFYEDFLAAYDPKLREDAGVYYTPVQVIRAKVRLVDEVLRTRLGKAQGFNSPGVTVLDPAAGTGAYPLAVVEMALEQTRKRGAGFVPGAASNLARSIFAFEFLVGPYAVAHLRLTQALRAAGGQLPAEGAPVFLSDTLESPFVAPPQTSLFERRLAQEHERARDVKASRAVWVCLGNPPYDRQMRDNPEQTRKGGWIRAGEGTIGNPQNAPLEAFLAPAREAGAGRHLKNLYNDYIYFWRFALWKVFENVTPSPEPEQNHGGGIVCFITASSYLRGPGFVGMRRMMRETFDELWVLDLEGDSLGARPTEGVFNIRVGTCIALGVRHGAGNGGTPAEVRYHKITGTRAQKFARLDEIEKLADVQWSDCSQEWQAPFLPRSGNAIYWEMPLLTDIFPWQHSGAQFKRTWPIAETEDLLRERWAAFTAGDTETRKRLFKETRDRKIATRYKSWQTDEKLTALDHETSEELPTIERYAFRSFDRQFCFADNRLGDYPKPVLWKSYGPRQVFLTGMTSEVYGAGPALTATPYVPDLHHFSGRGGKDIIPMWRDADATQPNVSRGVLERLGALYGHPVKPEDVFAAFYALLFPRAYVERFADELLIPGPRVPLPGDFGAFQEAARLGHELIRLHTWNERDLEGGAPTGLISTGTATYDTPVSAAPDDYPENFAYNPTTCTLRVGDGEFGHVAPALMDYSVSGLRVVESWLRYRMKNPSGRSSSALDAIRPASWSDKLSTELQQLLWTLEASLELEARGAALLAQILSAPLLGASEFPAPTPEERRAPNGAEEDDEQLDLPTEEAQ